MKHLKLLLDLLILFFFCLTDSNIGGIIKNDNVNEMLLLECNGHYWRFWNLLALFAFRLKICLSPTELWNGGLTWAK